METVLVGRSGDGVTELGGLPPIYGCYYLCLALGRHPQPQSLPEGTGMGAWRRVGGHMMKAPLALGAKTDDSTAAIGLSPPFSAV